MERNEMRVFGQTSNSLSLRLAPRSAQHRRPRALTHTMRAASALARSPGHHLPDVRERVPTRPAAISRATTHSYAAPLSFLAAAALALAAATATTPPARADAPVASLEQPAPPPQQQQQAGRIASFPASGLIFKVRGSELLFFSLIRHFLQARDPNHAPLHSPHSPSPPQDIVDVVALPDPAVAGATIYVTEVKRSLVDKLTSSGGGFFAEPSAASVTCVARGGGAVTLVPGVDIGGPEGRDIYSEKKSLSLVAAKTLRVRRVVDRANGSVLYVSYSTRLGPGGGGGGSGDPSSTDGAGGGTGSARYRTSVCALPLVE